MVEMMPEYPWLPHPTQYGWRKSDQASSSPDGFGFNAVMNIFPFHGGQIPEPAQDTIAKPGDVNADKRHVIIARLNAADTLCHKLE